VNDDPKHPEGSYEDKGSSDTDEELQPASNDTRQCDKIEFYILCLRLEQASNARKLPNGKRPTKRKLFQNFFCGREVFSDMDAKRVNLDKLELLRMIRGKKRRGSFYSMLRLIFPDRDGVRPHLGLKERSIARHWGDALGLNRNSSAYHRLQKYTDPTYANININAKPGEVGDLGIAVYEVLSDRMGSDSSKITIGKLNVLLDELAMIYKEGLTKSAAKTKAAQKTTWVSNIQKLGLSPLEQKWLVKIILHNCNIDIGFETFISNFHPRAVAIYNSNRSLKHLCAALSDPEWMAYYEHRCKRRENLMLSHQTYKYLPRLDEGVKLGVTLSPQLSQRTSFESAMLHIVERHRVHARKEIPDSVTERNFLPMKFPSFLCEVKLDGERIISHVSNGVVRMQTRRDNWVSALYSPLVGPPLRRALTHNDVDCILDGELIAWDGRKQDVIPFGQNKTVAKARRLYLNSKGILDDRDLDLHDGSSERVLTVSAMDSFASGNVDLDYVGYNCWLKYVVFLMCSTLAEDAEKVLQECLAPFFSQPCDIPKSGSIIDLELFKRRTILNHILRPQQNEVEIVQSHVIRGNGDLIDATKYFSYLDESPPEIPLPVYDSVDCLFNRTMRYTMEIDNEIRREQTDEEIEEARARNTEIVYDKIVNQGNEEGIIFKDLNSPYVSHIPLILYLKILYFNRLLKIGTWYRKSEIRILVSKVRFTQDFLRCSILYAT